MSPLYMAVILEREEMVRLLLSRRADPDLKEHKRGDTVLHAAVLMGHLEIVKLLIVHRAKISARNKGNITPLMYALNEGKVEVARILSQNTPAAEFAKHIVEARQRSGKT